MTTREQREQWRRLWDAATPGPWAARQGEDYLRPGEWAILFPYKPEGDFDSTIPIVAEVMQKPDALMIASARTAVPALLDDVERLERRIAEAPHEPECDCLDHGPPLVIDESRCSCWKSEK